MCDDKCKHPELKPQTGKCSKQQIEKCHGTEKKHTCSCENK